MSKSERCSKCSMEVGHGFSVSFGVCVLFGGGFCQHALKSFKKHKALLGIIIKLSCCTGCSTPLEVFVPCLNPSEATYLIVSPLRLSMICRYLSAYDTGRQNTWREHARAKTRDPVFVAGSCIHCIDICGS